MTGAPRPAGEDTGRPPAEALTDPFWTACQQRRLVRPVCDRCGHSFFVPTWSCPRCQSEQWHYRDSSGRGRVASHTTVHRGPDPSWPTPYVLGVVDLDDGWSMLTRLEVEPPDESIPGALIGTPVAVRFVSETRPPFRVLPAFEPR